MFWVVAGRVADWGPLPPADEVERRTALALATRPPNGAPECVAPDAVHELRIVSTWLESHPEARVLALDPPPPAKRIAAFVGSV